MHGGANNAGPRDGVGRAHLWPEQTTEKLEIISQEGFDAKPADRQSALAAHSEPQPHIQMPRARGSGILHGYLGDLGNLEARDDR